MWAISESNKQQFIFTAGFHVGIPLLIAKDADNSKWEEIRNKLMNTFNNSSFFSTDYMSFPIDTSLPLGNPLYFKCLNFNAELGFFEIFKKNIISKEDIELDNVLIIYPSGVVSIIGRGMLKKELNENDLSSLYDDFQDEIEARYAELSQIFVRAANIIYSSFSDKQLQSCNLFYLQDIVKISKLCKETLSSENRTYYDDVLMDVYYILYNPYTNEEKLEIGYVRTEIFSTDINHLFYLAITHSTFIGMIWLIKKLDEITRKLQNILLSENNDDENNIVLEVKLLRIFCFNFINESKPIRIRIKEDYLIPMEKFWEEERLSSLVKQVEEQVSVLEKMFDWLDDTKSEKFNSRIGLAAIMFSVISISAVIAQLISTLDISNGVPLNSRLLFILSGSTVGILIVLIGFIPFRRIRKWIKNLSVTS